MDHDLAAVSVFIHTRVSAYCTVAHTLVTCLIQNFGAPNEWINIMFLEWQLRLSMTFGHTQQSFWCSLDIIGSEFGLSYIFYSIRVIINDSNICYTTH